MNHQVPTVHLPNQWLEESQHKTDELCRMDEIQSLQVLLIPSIERSVCFVQETQCRLVDTGEAVMKVDQTVVVLDVLIEGVHDVPVWEERVSEHFH